MTRCWLGNGDKVEIHHKGYTLHFLGREGGAKRTVSTMIITKIIRAFPLGSVNRIF